MNELKPVAWLLMDGTIISEYSYNLRKLKEDGDIPLFTQRTWVGLTDEEFQYCVELKNFEAIAEEVEAKLKEKNT